MRRLCMMTAILLQALALAWIVYERENVLQHGTIVYLRTAPVDPSDPMRGDYVQLSYDANHIPVTRAEPGLYEDQQPRDTRVYVQLELDERQVARATRATREPPANALYLRGYTTQHWRFRSHHQNLSVRYGIEKLFVEQDAGKLIENMRGDRNNWQRPMEVAVAVGKNGIGVIRDYRWAPYAARLELPDPSENPNQPRPTSPLVRFSIRNENNMPMVLLNPDSDCGFRLEAADGQAVSPADNGCATASVQADDFISLAPGEEYTRIFDLRDPRWHIRLQEGTKPEQTGEIGSFDNFQRFRLVYSAPDLSMPDNSRKPWIGSISSPAFSARGRVD